MSEDDAWGVEAENKVVIRGSHQFTLADLRIAGQELNARGVPGKAAVTVPMNGPGGRWAIMAKWVPEPGIKLPEDPTPTGLHLEEDAEVTARKIQEERGRSGRWLTCSECGERITPMVGRPGEYVHMNPPPPEAAHLARLDTQG